MIALLRSRAADLVLGAVYAVGGGLDVLIGEDLVGPLAPNLLLALVLAACVAVRRRAPLATMAGFMAVLVVMAAWFTPPQQLTLPFFGLLLFPYSAGSRLKRPAGVALMVVLLGVVALVDGLHERVQAEEIVFPMAFALAAFMSGRSARSRAQLASELREAARRAQETRESEHVAAVVAERRRIAREIHDVVAHSISVMVVQAGGARRILGRDPERAMAAAAEIERSGREALTEMRRLLGVLDQREGGADRRPQPGMAALDHLLERARAAGLPVELRHEGEPRVLPPGIDLAAYRIVQEALTNALQHAHGAPTGVLVRWSEDSVELEIANGGTRAVRPSIDEDAGHGLIGMRERARLYGGELHAGHRTAGGFEVKARLPLEPQEVA